MRIAFRPRVFDRVCVCLLVLPGLQMVIAAVLLAIGPRPSELHCDRATRSCTTFFPTAFHGGDTYRHDLAPLHDSRVVEVPGREQAWKVGNGSAEIILGQGTRVAERIAQYRQLASDFQAFLADPQRATFDVTYRDLTAPPFWLFAIMGFVMSYFGFRWWRGWYAELELDGAAGVIRIHRKPMWLGGPRRLVVARADARLEASVQRRAVGRGQRANFAVIALRDAAGKRVFNYTTLYDRKSKAALDEHMAALHAFFAAG